MRYKVNGTRVNTTECETLVEGSIKVHYAEFMFDETWDEYKSSNSGTITAVFKREDMQWEQLLVDGRCEVPWEALQKHGVIRVGVYGETGEKRRPTLWAPPQVVHPGADAGDISNAPTPSKWQQLLDELRRITGADPETIKPYIYEYFVDSPEVIKQYVYEYLAANPPANGDKGDPGVTPHIGESGNWYIGDTDTGVKARGEKGDDGDAFVYEDFTEEQLEELTNTISQNLQEHIDTAVAQKSQVQIIVWEADD